MNQVRLGTTTAYRIEGEQLTLPRRRSGSGALRGGLPALSLPFQSSGLGLYRLRPIQNRAERQIETFLAAGTLDLGESLIAHYYLQIRAENG